MGVANSTMRGWNRIFSGRITMYSKAKVQKEEKPSDCMEDKEPSPCGPCDPNTTAKDGTCKLGVPNDPTGRYYYACYVRVDMNTCANGLVWDQDRKVCYSDL